MRDVVRILVSFLSFYFRYIMSCTLVLWPFDILCNYIWLLYILMYVIHLSLHELFPFSLYTHVSYLLYAIYYFCFTLRCRDDFCLKCFRNTSCQSLLVINSLLTKFFKSLCYDRFYCIQRVWVEWFLTSLICSFVCCGFVTDCQRGRLLRYMWFNVRNIWQNFM